MPEVTHQKNIYSPTPVDLGNDSTLPGSIKTVTVCSKFLSFTGIHLVELGGQLLAVSHHHIPQDAKKLLQSPQFTVLAARQFHRHPLTYFFMESSLLSGCCWAQSRKPTLLLHASPPPPGPLTVALLSIKSHAVCLYFATANIRTMCWAKD